MQKTSFNEKTTIKIAAEFLKKIKPLKSRAVVIGLEGELGAGKTTFVKGVAMALGIRKNITSPTFLIIRSYNILPGSQKKFNKLFHIDAYRLVALDELLKLGFKEIIRDPRNIVLVEWADKIKKIMPKKTIWIKLSHGKKETERTIKISNG